MGKEYVAESLLEAFAAHDLAGKRVLLPRAAVARDLVPNELARRGAHVDVVEAYRTVPPEHLAGACARHPGAAARTASPSPVPPPCAIWSRPPAPSALRGIPVASIGPITTQTARDLGVEVAIQAKVFNVEGLVEAVLAIVN